MAGDVGFDGDFVAGFEGSYGRVDGKDLGCVILLGIWGLRIEWDGDEEGQ